MMNIKTYRPTQWDSHVPENLKEPFPWAHPNYPKSFHPFSNPWGTVIFASIITAFGTFLGGSAIVDWAQTGNNGALWAGLFIIFVSVVIGGWGMFVGAVRLSWKSRFTHLMGFSPFDRKP